MVGTRIGIRCHQGVHASCQFVSGVDPGIVTIDAARLCCFLSVHGRMDVNLDGGQGLKY